MISAEKRQAVYLLHDEGMSIRDIAKNLHISRKCVRRIIAEKGSLPRADRQGKKSIDSELIRKLYVDCDGYIQRIHEKIKEEEHINIGYSTLTRMVRSLGLGVPTKNDKRDCKVPDEPGKEMQHDTSPYKLKLGDHKMNVVGSSLYYRYSKRRYLKFYRSFTRFQMKCFFHEALTHFGYVAGNCIIDNTNLAVSAGSGANAIMSSEMIAFAKDHGGFTWQAHRIMHSDRKGGVESGFWFVETNFFPGRQFESLEDLNQQAFDWATKRISQKPHAKTKLIPNELFEFEKCHLKKLPLFMPEPILLHERDTDQYGYAPFNANHYWVPGTGRSSVQMIEYSNRIKIIKNREELVEYLFPAYGTKNERIPKDPPASQKYPTKAQRSTQPEEISLRAIDPIVSSYLDFLLKAPASSLKRYRSIRRLHTLSLKLSPKLFVSTLSRALQYHINCLETIERIAILLMKESYIPIDYDGSDSEISEDTQARAIYQEGEMSTSPSFEKYDDLFNFENQNPSIKTKGDSDG